MRVGYLFSIRIIFNLPCPTQGSEPSSSIFTCSRHQSTTFLVFIHPQHAFIPARPGLPRFHCDVYHSKICSFYGSSIYLSIFLFLLFSKASSFLLSIHTPAPHSRQHYKYDVVSYVKCGSSAVECRTCSRESPGSNTPFVTFWKFCSLHDASVQSAV